MPKELQRYFIDHGFLWGEWLEPDQDSASYMRNLMFKGAPEISTAYLSYAARLTAAFAHEMGKTEDEAYLNDVAKKAQEAFRYFGTEDGTTTGDRQCNYVRPVALNLLSESEKQAAVDGLASAVKRNNNHLNTGFLTTHDLCRVLTDYGHSETAYDLLLQPGCPGWLYPVHHGATSIWETWDGVREDGTVHHSLNHYSYGAVVGWLFDSVCGIRIEEGKIIVCPHPDRRLGYVDGRYDSPFGTIVSKWAYDGGKITYSIEIPNNCTAELRLPGQAAVALEAGTHLFRQDET